LLAATVAVAFAALDNGFMLTAVAVFLAGVACQWGLAESAGRKACKVKCDMHGFREALLLAAVPVAYAALDNGFVLAGLAVLIGGLGCQRSLTRFASEKTRSALSGKPLRYGPDAPGVGEPEEKLA